MFGFLKGLMRGRGPENGGAPLALAPQGEVFTRKLMPDYAQLCAEGRVWRYPEVTATASVVALPTTASLFTVGNNESDDGLWYVVLAAYAFNVANAAAIDSFSLVGCLSQLPATTGGLSPTLVQDQAKTTIKSMCGPRGGGYNGRAILDTGVAITDDVWFPLGQSSGSTGVASAAGAALFNWLHGLILIPPKGLIGLVTVATSTSNTTNKGLIMAEVPKSYLLAA